MTDPDIRLLRFDDLHGALELSSEAGWNQRREDWQMLLQLAPAGGFVAVSEGRLIGTSIGIDYGGFAWIAMMLVDPVWRGRGLGGRLLEAAMAAVPPDRPIRLDATPRGRHLYRRYGFEDEALLTRHVRDRPGPAEATAKTRPLKPGDLRLVAELDRRVFGGDRHAVLEWAAAQAPKYAQVVPGEEGLQYCLGRPGRLFDQIGPLVAADEDVARALLSAALAAAGSHAIVLDAFDAHAGFAAWLREAGFRAERPLFRMVRPGTPDIRLQRGDTPVEFAIFGPEFG